MLNTAKKILNATQMRQLKMFGSVIANFNANLAFCSSDCEIVFYNDAGFEQSSTNNLKDVAGRVIKEEKKKDAQWTDGDVYQFDEENTFLAWPLRHGTEVIGILIIEMFADCKPYCKTISYMLRLFSEKMEVEAKTNNQIELVSAQLSETYEELVLLHKLSANMKATESDHHYLQMACDSLTDIVMVEGIAIVLDRVVNGYTKPVLAAGSGLIDVDEKMISLMSSRLATEINNGKAVLLDSDVDVPFKYEWQEKTKSIVIVPLFGKDSYSSGGTVFEEGSNIIGFMVAVNRLNKKDFDSIDIKLFNSVANSCAVFVENERLFGDLKELFIGSLKALTSSIDAKDAYTRGHSDRVAFISKWIAEHMVQRGLLDESQIGKVYLAGLLHDVGKMGVNEAVLCKNGRLNDDEMDVIRMHPSIGAGILSGIKQMKDIISGVLCHHERVDGTGYPGRLKGEQITVLAKIIGLADSFDAMTTKRIYRDAMSLDKAIKEIKKCSGSQFDEIVTEVFLASDLDKLWSMLQDDFSYNQQLADYGTEAVGTLIR